MSSLDRLETQLERAHRLNPVLAAMIAITDEAAREDARRADYAERSGASLGLLHGMTVSVKDNIDTAGTATTAGAAFLRDRVPNRDAPVVERLRRAGAVITGKANMAEVAFGSRSFSAVGGQCRNPWDTDRIPGGSSGGSAVSVAAGMCTGSLGTDTGGSVRLPAAINNVSGLRPTHGRIPNSGVLPVSESNDTVGPLARRVEDVALIFAVIAGYDEADPYSVDIGLPNFLPALRDGIAGRRIGVPRNHYFDDLAPGVGDAVMAGARVLEQAGARLVEITVPMVGEAQAKASLAIFSDACHVFNDRLLNDPGSFTPSVYERMKTGLAITGVQYAEAQAFRARWRRALQGVFQEVDMILSPTITAGAPLIEDGRNLLEATRSVTTNTYCGAFAGIPGLSVPCGFTPDRLPLGLQLEAAWWNEPLLFQAGIAYQAATDHHLQTPPL